jgi:2-hydroxychromene-2-carboxylate isomerase
VKRGPRVHFSFRSPYSWMAIERLCRAVPDPHRVLEFVPYWDPDPQTERALREGGGELHYVQMSKAKHLYILQDAKRLSARLGLSMRWPIDVDPWWEVPHLAFLKARELGAAAEFYDQVIAARWGRGEDVCDPAVVARLGDEIGLDGAALAGATDDPAVRAAGVDCMMRAYEDDIFGIPYFRLGRHRFWGLDRLDDFLAALLPTLTTVPAASEPLAGVPAPARAAVGGYDTDTAGGCG